MKSNLEQQLKDASPRGLTDSEHGLVWARIQQDMRHAPVRRFGMTWSPLVHMSVAFALIILIASGGTATAFAANNARPGDLLFPIDRALEEIQIAITPKAHEDALRVAFAEERLQEVTELLSDVGVSESAQEAAVLAFAQASVELTDESDVDKDVDVETNTDDTDTPNDASILIPLAVAPLPDTNRLAPATERVIEAHATEALRIVAITRDALVEADDDVREIVDDVIDEISSRVASVDTDMSFNDELEVYSPRTHIVQKQREMVAHLAAADKSDDEAVSTAVMDEEIQSADTPAAIVPVPVQQAPEPVVVALNTIDEDIAVVTDEPADEVMEEVSIPESAADEDDEDAELNIDIHVVFENGNAYIDVEIDDDEDELFIASADEDDVIDEIEDRYDIDYRDFEDDISFKYIETPQDEPAEPEDDELTLVAPNGGEVYTKGEDTLQFSWTPREPGVETIQLIPEDEADDSTYVLYSHKVYNYPINTDGFFEYDLKVNSSIPEGDYRAEILSPNIDENYTDISNSAFTIQDLPKG